MFLTLFPLRDDEGKKGHSSNNEDYPENGLIIAHGSLSTQRPMRKPLTLALSPGERECEEGAGSLQIGPIVLFDKFVDLVGHAGVAAHLGGQNLAERDLQAILPGIGLPEL